MKMRRINQNVKVMKTSEKKNHNRLVDTFGPKSFGPKIPLKSDKQYPPSKSKPRDAKRNLRNKNPNNKKSSQNFASKTKVKQEIKNKALTKKNYKVQKETLNKEYNEIKTASDDQREKLTGTCFGSIKDNLKQLVKSPDSSRVVQYFLCQSDVNIKNQIFEKLKDEILPLFLDKHGAFVVEKMMKNLDSDRQKFIFDIILKNIATLASKKNSSKVIDGIYKTILTSAQKSELLHRFYGPQFILDTKTVLNEAEIWDNPEKSQTVLSHLKKHVSRLLRKKTISRTLTHCILLTYLKHADGGEVKSVCKELVPFIQWITLSEPGVELAIAVLLNTDNADHKIIVRSIEDSLPLLCSNSNAYIFICATIHLVRLEGLLRNRIGKMMNEKMDFFFENKFASRILNFLVSSSCEKRDFPSDMQNKLSLMPQSAVGDENVAVQSSLLKSVTKKIVAYIVSNEDNFAENMFMQTIALKVLKRSESYAKVLIESIFKTLLPMMDQISFYDLAKYHHWMKKIIKADKLIGENKFSDLFIGNVDKIKISNIYATNRGCFILILLLENASEESAQLLKNILSHHKPNLQQLQSSNAPKLYEMLG